MVSVIVLTVAFALVTILFVIAWTTGFATKGYSTSACGLWDMGFGTLDPRLLIALDNFGTPITLSLLANAPQVVLAVVYYLYGGILNSMFTSQEWSSLAFKTQ